MSRLKRLTIWILSSVSVLIAGLICSDLLYEQWLEEEDLPLKAKLREAVSQLPDGGRRVISFEGVSDICIQGPYVDKEGFESVANKKIARFNFIETDNDGRFRLHFFREHGDSTQIEVTSAMMIVEEDRWRTGGAGLPCRSGSEIVLRKLGSKTRLDLVD